MFSKQLMVKIMLLLFFPLFNTTLADHITALPADVSQRNGHLDCSIQRPAEVIGPGAMSRSFKMCAIWTETLQAISQ